jgi:hypothetical protein
MMRREGARCVIITPTKQVNNTTKLWKDEFPNWEENKLPNPKLNSLHQRQRHRQEGINIVGKKGESSRSL